LQIATNVFRSQYVSTADAPHKPQQYQQCFGVRWAHGRQRAISSPVHACALFSLASRLGEQRRVLAIGNIRPPDQGQVSVNVGVSVGYVIDLTPMHAHTPQAPNTVQVIDNAEGGE
jgi:hypothetical protein